MAGKVTAPSAQIFTSDPLEQIAMRGMQDRDMSGLNYMFLNAFGQRRQMDQDTYMQGVSQSNQQAGMIAEKEIRQKQQEEFLKSAIKMAEMGQSADTMPVLQAIIGGRMNEGTDLNRRRIEAKINADNRDPSGGGGDKVSGKVDVGPAGSGFVTYDVKGRDPASVAGKLRELQIQQLKAQGLNPNAQANPADATAALNRRYGGNVPQ